MQIIGRVVLVQIIRCMDRLVNPWTRIQRVRQKSSTITRASDSLAEGRYPSGSRKGVSEDSCVVLLENILRTTRGVLGWLGSGGIGIIQLRVRDKPSTSHLTGCVRRIWTLARQVRSDTNRPTGTWNWETKRGFIRCFPYHQFLDTGEIC